MLRELIMSHKRSDRSLFGCPIAQSFASIVVLEQLLKEQKPVNVVELGTSTGVLSTYLQCYANRNGAGFVTYDINKPKAKPHYAFKQEDIRSSTAVYNITNMINGSKGHSLLIVDANDPKSEDINFYAPLLKSGTIIAGHDCILNDDKPFKWGFRLRDINWEKVELLHPYHEYSKELDTRMLYLIVK